MSLRPVVILAALPLAFALGACGQTAVTAADPDERDPALTGALGDRIMIDPDLVDQNQASAALSGGGPATGEIPAAKRTLEEIAAAKAEASRIVGGKLQSAPSPVSGGDAASPESFGQLARALPGKGPACAAKAGYGAVWAARLPPEFARPCPGSGRERPGRLPAPRGQLRHPGRGRRCDRFLFHPAAHRGLRCRTQAGWQ
jgi:hypothetical protein